MGACGAVNVSNLFISSPNQLSTLVAPKIIYDNTLTGAAASIDTSTLEGTYNYLQVILSWTSCGNNAALTLNFNGDAGNNYNYIYSKDAAAVVSNAGVAAAYIYVSSGTADGSVVVEIPNNASNPKVCQVQGGQTGHIYSGVAGWTSTDRITRIVASNTAGQFGIGTRMIVLGM